MDATDVVIIGAGPNGLALSAHLKAAGVEHVVLGYPLATWRNHMPKGMMLKSEPYGSDVAAPVEGYRVSDFCRLTGTEYVDRVQPLKLETFLDYGDWFKRELVPEVREVHATSMLRSESGFLITTSSGNDLMARRVVIASGLIPFAYVPALLKALPDDLVSHSSAHSEPARFRGRRIGVIGAGQSALELAALLSEAGANVEIIAREPALFFNAPMPERDSWLDSVRRPQNRLCETWHCWCYYTFPDAFRALPEHVRVTKARTFLGPSGSWWLRERVEGRVPIRAGARIIEAAPADAHVKLSLDVGGSRQEAEYDHVIAGTGFRLDVNRLGFVSSELMKALVVAGGAPVLSRFFESTVPGLFFVGAMAAPSLGPNMRFLSGTHFAARRLTRRLQRQHHAPHGGRESTYLDLSSPAPAP